MMLDQAGDEAEAFGSFMRSSRASKAVRQQ
jgi:hypothetical protein